MSILTSAVDERSARCGCRGGNSDGVPTAVVRQLQDQDLPAVIASDALAFGVSRHDVISALFAHSSSYGLFGESKLCAFALCRRFGRGDVIGPVVATNDEGAIAVVRHPPTWPSSWTMAGSIRCGAWVLRRRPLIARQCPAIVSRCAGTVSTTCQRYQGDRFSERKFAYRTAAGATQPLAGDGGNISHNRPSYSRSGSRPGRGTVANRNH
jgi:GNAT acetyltransferase-like protein